MDVLTGAAIGGLACLALCVLCAVVLVVMARRTPPAAPPAVRPALPAPVLPPPPNPTPTPVGRQSTFRVLDSSNQPPQGVAFVAATFWYDPCDPYAVTVTLTGSGEPAPWTFARELLIDGCVGMAGQGDVRVWPGRAGVYLAICSPEGSMLLLMPTHDVVGFVRAMLAAVPLGSEGNSVDLDLEVERLRETMP